MHLLAENQAVTTDRAAGSPFQPGNVAAYRRWRDAKLSRYPATAGDLVVEVADPLALTDAETVALRAICRKTNMAIYASRAYRAEKEIAPAVGARFGLRRLDNNPLADDDGVSAVQVTPEKSRHGYIPYTNRRLLWHTDGYYNSTARNIRAFVLHCVRPAAEGGANRLLDHEIAYILLRDANPDYIRALMAPDAMTIPAKTEGGREARAAVRGPVFSIDPVDGALHMRYTARTRSIEWKPDVATRAAVKFLEDLLAGDSPYLFHHALAAGQGLLCNNVLHNRSAFTDAVDKGAGRLIYRARYYDRVAGTDHEGGR